MNKDKIISEYTLLGRLIGEEVELGEAIINLTAQQRKAHQATQQQQDKCRHLMEDKNVISDNK